MPDQSLDNSVILKIKGSHVEQAAHIIKCLSVFSRAILLAIKHYNFFRQIRGPGLAFSSAEAYVTFIENNKRDNFSSLVRAMSGHNKLTNPSAAFSWSLVAEGVMEELDCLRKKIELCRNGGSQPIESPEKEFHEYLSNMLIRMDKLNNICKKLIDRNTLFASKAVSLPDKVGTNDENSKGKPWSW